MATPPPSPPNNAAPRSLGTIVAAAVVVANMIGTGIFTTSGLLLKETGSPVRVLIAWGLGGVLALSGALVYAELGASLPRIGGEYVYLSRAIHPAVGFISGFVSLLVGFAAPIAASALAFAKYLHALFPGVQELPAAATLLLATAGLHSLNVRTAGHTQTVFTAFKVLLITVFVIGGVFFGNGHASFLLDVLPPTGGNPPSGIGAMAVALVFVSYSYSGWNGAAYLAGEMRSPATTLPRALLFGTALVSILYVALNLVFFMAAPAAELAGVVEIGHHAAIALFGQHTGRLLSALISLALVSSVSSMMMSGPRVYLAMADDGRLRFLGRRSNSGAPIAAVWTQAAIAMFVLLTATFDRILYSTGFLLSLMAAATVVAAAILRWREPELPRPFRVPLWPLPALMFLALSLWMVGFGLAERPSDAFAGLAVIVAGGVVYFVTK